MERTALPGRLTWQTGTVVDLVWETPEVKSIVLELPRWPGHRAGQHVDVRLTADDGYSVERSYSIASAPEDDHILLTVERLQNGEVSPYLLDELRIGDDLELRGPIGDRFVWEQGLGGPLLLVAGGAGLVPFRSMLRHHRATQSTALVCLLCSAPSLPLLLYREELMRIAAYDDIDIAVTLTREQPEGWRGYRRTIDEELLAEVAWPPDQRPLVYACGPTAFVESVADSLVRLGHDPNRIRRECFG
jgi:ferredoxin-NADP reductase